MKMLCATAFFAVIIPFSTTAGGRHCLFRIHAEANPNDTAVFALSVPAKFFGKEVSIEKVPRITEGDVVAFYPYPAANGTFGVLFQLDEHGTTALEALSIELRGSLLFVLINGRPVTELLVDKRVSDGRIYIASGLTKRDIDSMKKDWRLIGQRKR